MYRYFISYVFSTRQGSGNGWAEMTLTQPIRSGADVASLSAKLKAENDLDVLTITGWQKFED